VEAWNNAEPIMVLLCLHNSISAKIYINKIKQYLNYEDFRGFLEKSSLDDMNLISMLKILDKQCFDVIKYETPITQKTKSINCFGPSSYFRPDFQEFRERTINNFTPEPSTTLIIILPCSSKKPYSESKSHRQFYKIIRKFPDFPNFQEIILTSPLGAIPRQLENIYPVNSYDISVTGYWDNEELSIAADMLVKILEKYDNSIPIICHLEGGYLEIIKKAQKKLRHNFYFSKIHEKLTSIDSLDSLENLIKKHKNKFPQITKNQNKTYLSKTWTRKFVKILDYQFGVGSGIKILSNGLIIRRNKYGNKIVFWGGGVDTQKVLSFGTPAAVEEQVLQMCGIFSKDGGFVFNTVHNIQANTPIENVIAMFNAVRKFNGIAAI